MCEIKTVQHEQFGQFRICTQENKEWFCLSDTCKALEISNVGNVKSRLSKRGIRSVDTPTYNQHGTMVMQPMTYIDEANLYRCIFQSRKAEAEQFQNWVFEEVLPQIRKTGGYIPVKPEDDEKAILAKAMIIMQKTLEQKDKIIEAQRPKVQFAEALEGSDASIHISEMAKLLTQNGYETGRTRFFSWLRAHGYIFKQTTEPIQEWVERGIFEVKATLVETHHGAKQTITPLITGKGQAYFLELLCH